MSQEPSQPRQASMVLAALYYARRGFGVFPLGARSKIPLTEHGCLDASRDESTIRTWWDRWPFANVAIATGEPSSGVWVLDVDGPEGEAALAELVRQHGELPVTLEARTSRGRHLYLRVPDGHELSRNSAKRLPKLDTRATGGYVVAPPSVHPDGSLYEWAEGRGPKDMPAAEAPPWLLEAFAPRRPSPTTPREPTTLPPSSARDIRRKWCLGALEAEARELSEAPDGTRNDKLNSAAYKMGGYVGAGHLDESEVEHVLLGACIWPDRDERKDRDTLRRGLTAGIAQPRALPADVEARAFRQVVEEARRAARATLNDAFDRVARLRDDERARGLEEQARRLRDLVTSEALEPRRVTDALEDAANRCGLVDSTSWSAVRAIIARGLGLAPAHPAPPRQRSSAREEAASWDGIDAPPPGDDDGGDGGDGDGLDLPEIIDTFDEHAMAELADEYLARDPELYQRGGLLVQALIDDAPGAGVTRERTAAQIREVDIAWLRALSTRRVLWMRWKRTKAGELEKVRIKPPAHAIAAISKRGQWRHIRKLEGITSTPFFRADGDVVRAPGYDDRSGVLCSLHEEFPPVPDKPTSTDVEGAVEFLRHLVTDFPFENDDHRAAWMASVLTPLCRHAFRGPSPLFLVDANTPGVGKGKLAVLTGIISTGRPPEVRALSSDENEQRKVITSIAIAGNELVLFDNIKATLGGGVLEAALTTDTWSDRLLGASESYSGPLLTTWMGTANNAQLTTDMVRRVCHIRLVTPLERPEERTGFTIPDVEAFARANRPKLVVAALTILRGWHVAGRPRADLPAWGSYEGWSGLVRQALVWARAGDPGASRTQLREMADSGSELLGQLIDGLTSINASSIMKYTAGELLVKAKSEHGANLKEALDSAGGGRGGLTSRTVGKLLSRYRGRIHDGRVIRGEQDPKRKQLVWWVDREKEVPDAF